MRPAHELVSRQPHPPELLPGGGRTPRAAARNDAAPEPDVNRGFLLAAAVRRSRRLQRGPARRGLGSLDPDAVSRSNDSDPADADDALPRVDIGTFVQARTLPRLARSPSTIRRTAGLRARCRRRAEMAAFRVPSRRGDRG